MARRIVHHPVSLIGWVEVVLGAFASAPVDRIHVEGEAVGAEPGDWQLVHPALGKHRLADCLWQLAHPALDKHRLADCLLHLELPVGIGRRVVGIPLHFAVGISGREDGRKNESWKSYGW